MVGEERREWRPSIDLCVLVCCLERAGLIVLIVLHATDGLVIPSKPHHTTERKQ